MKLREYQSALAGDVAMSLQKKGSVVLQLPTGGGKTHIASTIAQEYRQRGKRIWFVCHRREIIQQTSAALEAYGVAHGVVSPGYELWPKWQVQVCSVGSLPRLLTDLPQPDLIIWDECHHVAAPSWSRIKDKFPKAKHLGLTATPERLDGVGLGAWFADLICGPSTSDLIEGGHLSRYRLFAPTIPDLRAVKIRAGDYAKEQLEEAMAGDALVGDVVEHYQRLAPSARAIAFCVSVAASKTIADRFNAAGIPAMHVDATTSDAARDGAVSALAVGSIRVLCNVEIFTEGFDLPAIDAVILLRPTRSFALYRQMVGRGLRTAEGKSATIILDHASVVHDHGTPSDGVEWSLDGKARFATAVQQVQARLRRCPSCSALHATAPSCVECGHVYRASDRWLDEIAGDLKEYRRPEGYVSRRELAALVGCIEDTIKRWVYDGLPVAPNGLHPTTECLNWITHRPFSRNVLKPGPGFCGQFETLTAFAERVGRPFGTVAKFKLRGLPMAPCGWVQIEPALRWYVEDQARIAKAADEGRKGYGLNRSPSSGGATRSVCATN